MRNALIFILLFCCVSANSTNTYSTMQTTNSPAIVSEVFALLSHPEANILPADEIFLLNRSQWVVMASPQLSLIKGKNWLAIDITNHSADNATRYMLINAGQYVFKDMLFLKRSDKQEKPHNIEHEINNVVHSQITLKPYESVRLYLLLDLRSKSDISVKFYDFKQYSKTLSDNFLITGLAIGGIVAMALIMLCVFIANTNKAILLLTTFFTLQAAHLAVMYGINLYSFLPQYSELQGIETPILSSLSGIIMLWFCSELFKLSYINRTLYLVFHGFGWLMLLYVVISLFMPFQTHLLIANISQQLVSVLLLWLAIDLLKTKDKLANLFLIFVLTQATWSLLNIVLYGWYKLDATIFTVSFWLTGFLITFILSRQSTLQLAEKHQAQREALESAMQTRATQEELLATQEQAQEQLESSVQERTLELNIALQELEEANRELEQKNMLDELTGLNNRRFYDQKIQAEYRRSKRNLTPLSIIVVDIDHFKTVNDTYGHSAGDACLIQLAKQIKTVLRRSSDIGCRYGGEEFCLILPETDKTGAIALAQELRVLIENTKFQLDDQAINLTISCGISCYIQEKEATPVSLFNAADKALYRAKKHGRNQVQFDDIAVELPNTSLGE